MQIGDFFRVEHKDNDKSYLKNFFICTGGSTSEYIMGIKINDSSNYGHQIFNVKEWEVIKVSRSDAALSIFEAK